MVGKIKIKISSKISTSEIQECSPPPFSNGKGSFDRKCCETSTTNTGWTAKCSSTQLKIISGTALLLKVFTQFLETYIQTFNGVTGGRASIKNVDFLGDALPFFSIRSILLRFLVFGRGKEFLLPQT